MGYERLISAILPTVRTCCIELNCCNCWLELAPSFQPMDFPPLRFFSTSFLQKALGSKCCLFWNSSSQSSSQSWMQAWKVAFTRSAFLLQLWRQQITPGFFFYRNQQMTPQQQVLKRSASLLRRGRLSWMILECWYSASKMRDMTRFMHSPIPGINFQVISMRPRNSIKFFLNSFISLSLNQLRIMESPRILVTKNITFYTFPFTLQSISINFSSTHLRISTPYFDTYSRTLFKLDTNYFNQQKPSFKTATSSLRCLNFSPLQPSDWVGMYTSWTVFGADLAFSRDYQSLVSIRSLRVE